MLYLIYYVNKNNQQFMMDDVSPENNMNEHKYSNDAEAK